MSGFHYTLIITSMILYLLGRICDDMEWHHFVGLSTLGFLSIALGTLTASAILIMIVRLKQQDGFKTIFFHSQIRFIIPWALVILECIFVFQIFSCYHEIPENLSDIAMDYKSCCLYCVVLLMTNLNYSLLCNTRGDLPLLMVFQIVLFAEIIYNGTLLITFINDLEGKAKDYSILFVSILIAWQIIVMDLIFRGAYEEREKDHRHHELKHMVNKHHEKCRKGHAELPNDTNEALQKNNDFMEELPQDTLKVPVKDQPKK